MVWTIKKLIKFRIILQWPFRLYQSLRWFSFLGCIDIISSKHVAFVLLHHLMKMHRKYYYYDDFVEKQNRFVSVGVPVEKIGFLLHKF